MRLCSKYLLGIALLTAMFSLSACGNKGALYLPDNLQGKQEPASSR